MPLRRVGRETLRWNEMEKIFSLSIQNNLNTLQLYCEGHRRVHIVIFLRVLDIVKMCT